MEGKQTTDKTPAIWADGGVQTRRWDQSALDQNKKINTKTFKWSEKQTSHTGPVPDILLIYSHYFQLLEINK